MFQKKKNKNECPPPYIDEQHDGTSLKAEYGGMNNLESLKSLLLALISLLISGVVLVSVYLILSPELRKSHSTVEIGGPLPKVFQGNEMILRIGIGGLTDQGSVSIDELSVDNQAIVSRMTYFEASDFPIVHLRTAGRHSGQKIYFLWRNSASPNVYHRLLMGNTGANSVYQNISQHKDWRGKISEVGIDVYGDLRSAPLVLERMAFLPATKNAILRTALSEWILFEPWKHSSINHNRGAPKEALFNPTLAAASWMASSWLVLLAFYRKKSSLAYYAFIFCALAPWLCLDLLWQYKLALQNNETRYSFSGKSMHDKRKSDYGHELFNYSEHLKNNVLINTDSRVFILHNSANHNFDRLKLQYYLLPFNIYNFKQYPRKKYLKPGDYIITLGEIAKLRYEGHSGKLVWGNSNYIDATPALLIDEHQLGNVYVVPESQKE